MMERKFKHTIEIDEATRQIVIHRLYENGKKELYTRYDVPDAAAQWNREKFHEFSQMLGENLLIDSAAGRQLFGI